MLLHRHPRQGSRRRRRIRRQEAPPQHRQGRVDRRHHLPRPRCSSHRRDGPRAAAQRPRAPAGQPPRHPRPQIKFEVFSLI